MARQNIETGSEWNEAHSQANFIELYTAGIAVAGNATGLVALVGGGQTGATALSYGMNNVTTCATAADSVKLPDAIAGRIVRVKNSGATALAIFPFLADSIDALAANLSVSLDPGSTAQFHAISSIVWESDIDNSLTLNAPTTAKGSLRLLAANNDGETVTTLTNAPMEQASVISIPDPGAASANVLLTSVANDKSLVSASAVELSILAGALITVAELNRACDVSTRIVSITASAAISVATHENKICLLAEAGGDALVTLTLPEATGSGAKFKFLVTVVNTSSYVFVVADTTNANFIGNVINQDADLVGTIGALTYLAPANADTLTLNGTTTGGQKGDWIELIDVATDVWFATGIVSCPAGSNTANCFSAAV